MSTQADFHMDSALPRFRIKRGEFVIAVIAVAVLVALGISSVLESRSTEKRSVILSNIENPSASIIFTQRETLVFATKLALWSNGGTSRREVQIARNLLAQRLAVIDASGKSMGERANAGYWNAIHQADRIVAMAPTGILPESLHDAMNQEVIPVINNILAEARQLVVAYQKSIDDEMVGLAQETARRDAFNLTLLYLFIFLAALFLFLNGRSNFKNYRAAQLAIQRENARLQETLRQLSLAESTVSSLQDLDNAKNALISNVNHELRTPLTSIVGYVELLQREELAKSNGKVAQYLEIIERNSNILLKLVESLLSLSKFDAALGNLPFKEVNLSEVIENAIFTLSPSAKSRNISLIHHNTDAMQVSGDVAQLSQVFINLISNAVKFSPQGAEITIQESRDTESNFCRVAISDHGIGIPSEDIPHLFTRFFRGSNVETSQYEGTGLGLSIVHQVISNHGGTIEVASQLGSGTTFTVLLPLIKKGEITHGS
jgi:signal transduction histidine kinase